MRVKITKDPQIIKLINAVRRNAVLYDYRQPKFDDEPHKQSIWQQIAQECEMECVADAKTLWRKLQCFFMSCYRNELIRLVRANYTETMVGPLPQETQPTYAATEPFNDNIGTWSYYGEMRFVAPFRDKSSDAELERLIQLAKALVLHMDVAKYTHRQRLLAKNDGTSAAPMPENKVAAGNELATAQIASDTESGADELADENVHCDATTQTTMETLHLDIPPISEAELTASEQSLRSFFDAMFRATCALPPRLQRRMKCKTLQMLQDSQLLAEADVAK